jgi:hypothetical protein
MRYDGHVARIAKDGPTLGDLYAIADLHRAGLVPTSYESPPTEDRIMWLIEWTTPGTVVERRLRGVG